MLSSLSFALYRLGSPGMHLKPEQVASISAVCKGRRLYIGTDWIFGKSVCYEMIQFVMDCKLDSESGQYSSHCSLVLVQYVTSSNIWIGNAICPSPSVLA